MNGNVTGNLFCYFRALYISNEFFKGLSRLKVSEVPLFLFFWLSPFEKNMQFSNWLPQTKKLLLNSYYEESFYKSTYVKDYQIVG